MNTPNQAAQPLPPGQRPSTVDRHEFREDTDIPPDFHGRKFCAVCSLAGKPGDERHTVYQLDECRSCWPPAQIIWAESATTGAAIPVNAVPTSDGTVSLSPRPGRNPLARVVSPKLTFGRRDLRLPHQATCNRNWRRR